MKQTSEQMRLKPRAKGSTCLTRKKTSDATHSATWPPAGPPPAVLAPTVDPRPAFWAEGRACSLDNVPEGETVPAGSSVEFGREKPRCGCRRVAAGSLMAATWLPRGSQPRLLRPAPRCFLTPPFPTTETHVLMEGSPFLVNEAGGAACGARGALRGPPGGPPSCGGWQ